MQRHLLTLASVFAAVGAQTTGSYQTETHPSMTWQTCTAKGSCTTKNGKVVIDANWRWVHKSGDYKNCYTGNKWESSLCAKNADCTKNCVLEGADYTKTYGISTSGNALTLNFITKGSDSTNIGSRLYLMESDTKYQMFSMLNKEITFDVDLSALGCGLNGAVYFVSMDADGGTSKNTANKAGAKYGTGYCDAQCPRDLKFINGEANAEGWTASKNDQNAGVGQYGSCCAEMDLWEANSISTAYTPHSCTTVSQTRCTGDACGGTYSETRYAGVCDPDGCDFNSYRQGNKTFYGPGMTVDTKSKFTIVTQFIGSPLTEIKRFYVQNGNVIPNSESTIAGNPGNSLTTEFCKAQKKVFGDRDTFHEQGGMPSMSEALDKGMVLVMSLWDDHYSNMLWLDSTYPTDADPAVPGKGRGSCETTSGVPTDVESKQASSKVTYSNIKYGPIGSTFG